MTVQLVPMEPVPSPHMMRPGMGSLAFIVCSDCDAHLVMNARSQRLYPLMEELGKLHECYPKAPRPGAGV